MQKLCNPAPSKEAAALYDYLWECYGSKALTGQHTKTVGQQEIWHIQDVTGKLPAICGFEMLGYSPNVNYTDTDEGAIGEVMENVNTIDTAIEWAQKHRGIVTYCWHWFSPMRGHNKSFYTQYTDFDIRAAVEEGTPEHTATIRDIDIMADLLKRFRDAGIPILWRPLHEADGAWFWWGAYGAQACVKLYRLMYDRFVNLHKLNNLIWIWNSVSPDWYPGDDCVDIISRDVYAKNDGALKAEFEDVKKLNPDKIVALAECGIAPDPEKMKAKEAMWAWYMVWCGGFVMDDKGNSREQLKAIYESPLTVALDDLPWNRK